MLADEGKPDTVIAEALHTGLSTVRRTQQRFVEGGVQRALNEQPRPKCGTKLDEHARAMLVATACSAPSAGRARWTLRLLAERLVELKVVEPISHECVRQELKNDLKPWLKEQWCIPEVSSEFVSRIEDVLDLHAQPCDLTRPVVCFDEMPVQLTSQTRRPLPAKPGKPERYD